MKHEHNRINRRQMIGATGSLGASLLCSPLTMANATDIRMVARIFFDSYGTLALRQALRYAGDSGFVASMPQLLHAKTHAAYDNIIWNTYFTANSEENVIKTPQGNHVVLTIHGTGIFSKPEKIERTLRSDLDRLNDEGLTGQYAAKITQQEAKNLLHGRLPDSSEIPIYGFDEFNQGIKQLPMQYGVVLDLDIAKKTYSGYEEFNTLIDNPVMIIRSGGTETLSAYLEKARNRKNTEKMGNFHRYNSIDPDQPQTRILRLGGSKGGKSSDGSDLGLGRGYDSDWGLSVGFFPGLARYIAVAPRDISSDLQYLDFEL